MRLAIASVLVIMIVFGFVFPFAVTAITQIIFHHQANGSLITKNGAVVGSELIGQSFTGPGYFHPRPSAAGNGYDGSSSSGTNLGPTSDKFINGIHRKLADGKDDPGNYDGIRDLAAAYRKENRLPANAPIPADAVTRSASGLDPEISPANADLQVSRVALSRKLPEDRVRECVARSTLHRQFGVLGEPRVQVLKLNMTLDVISKAAAE